MIECIFTLDYEIYGDGRGDLRDLVYEPARRLRDVFDHAGVKFVSFVEALELEQIERAGTDPASADVRRQVRELYQEGHEIALHLHPQWANARFHDGEWELDYSEYNLCTLAPGRIAEIVDRAIAWLRDVLRDPQFTPKSFRAGNWLFQPTREAARVLAARGVKIDSSVFKGGLQHLHRLDYRPAFQNSWHWKFADDVNIPATSGSMIELPIYTQMVPFWRMLTGKRVGLQQRTQAAGLKSAANGAHSRRAARLRDYLRLRYPMKFDFCRMTFHELTCMVERVLRMDTESPAILKPLVAIGHTKDLMDFETIARFLAFLRELGIGVSTLAQVYPKCGPSV